MAMPGDCDTRLTQIWMVQSWRLRHAMGFWHWLSSIHAFWGHYLYQMGTTFRKPRPFEDLMEEEEGETIECAAATLNPSLSPPCQPSNRLIDPNTMVHAQAASCQQAEALRPCSPCDMAFHCPCK